MTFYQSFSYEDFVEGIRPSVFGGAVVYEVRDGVFKALCVRARQNPGRRHVLIIDEISRGNAAKVFGELITLIEEDKREGVPEALFVNLPYSRERFSAPSNVYILATMNTADRSVQALDTAFMRRFSFIEVRPEPEMLADCGIEDIDLEAMLETINQRIDRLAGRDQVIGHVYFLDIAKADDPMAALKKVFKDRILPLLLEYFYNDIAKIGLVLGKAFVEPVMDAIPFAGFDDDIAGRFGETRSWKLADIDQLAATDFRSIYAAEED